jgi:hypothetical protein
LPPLLARARSTKLTISLRKSFGLLMPAGFSIFSSSALSAARSKFSPVSGSRYSSSWIQ